MQINFLELSDSFRGRTFCVLFQSWKVRPWMIWQVTMRAQIYGLKTLLELVLLNTLYDLKETLLQVLVASFSWWAGGLGTISFSFLDPYKVQVSRSDMAPTFLSWTQAVTHTSCPPIQKRLSHSRQNASQGLDRQVPSFNQTVHSNNGYYSLIDCFGLGTHKPYNYSISKV